MESHLGDQLRERHLISDEQLKAALDRQRLHGGRLGQNLAALGFISEGQLDGLFHRDPAIPQSIEETGLPAAFISELILKHLFFMGEFAATEVMERVKLPFPVVDKSIDALRRDQLLEVKGAAQLNRASYRYALTDRGRARAEELIDNCRYLGPAPVSLEAYRTMVEAQSVKNILVREEAVREAFSQLIIGDDLLTRLGPAISSGRAIFLYGPPGNGKTTVAETIGKVLPETVYLPYAVYVGGEVISLFDPLNHEPAAPPADAAPFDPRWQRIKRPVIMVGGELTLKSLDLEYNPIANFYEAPLQMKANCGLLIIDDFGRQLVDPTQLLNRWIVPLERRRDFLTLHTGMKFELPFDQLIIFSTNLEPKGLVDEAFLRRIRYKIEIGHPSEEEYAAIFQRVCEANAIPFRPEMLEHLLENHYRRHGVKPNACHPRDLIDHIIDDAHYHNHPPELTEASLAAAWANYFVEL